MLKEIINDHRSYHSKFQVDNLITYRSGLTVFGMYHQACREVWKRFRSIKNSMLSLDDLKCKIELQQDKIEKAKKPAKKRILENDLKRFKFAVFETEKSLKELQQEFAWFYSQCETLKPMLGELTEERRRELELEYHIADAKRKIAIDARTLPKPSKSNIEYIASFPKDVRDEIFNGMRDKKNLIKWLDEDETEAIKIEYREFDQKMLNDMSVVIDNIAIEYEEKIND